MAGKRGFQMQVCLLRFAGCFLKHVQRKQYGARAFCCSAAQIWNSLPFALRQRAVCSSLSVRHGAIEMAAIIIIFIRIIIIISSSSSSSSSSITAMIAVLRFINCDGQVEKTVPCSQITIYEEKREQRRNRSEVLLHTSLTP